MDHPSPASPHCVGMGRRHSPWTASRQRKKNRQGDEHLPVCISEDDEAQEAGGMSQDCEDMVLDLQCMGLGALANRSRQSAMLASASGQRSSSSSGVDQRPQPFLFMPPALAQQALEHGRPASSASLLRVSDPCDSWGVAEACGRVASAVVLPCNQPTVSPRRNSASALLFRSDQGHAAALAALSPMALSSDHIKCTAAGTLHPLATSAARWGAPHPHIPLSHSGVGGGADEADQRKSNKRRSLENGMEGGGLSQALRSSGMTTVRDVPREGLVRRGAGQAALQLPLGGGAVAGGQQGGALGHGQACRRSSGLARTSLDGSSAHAAGSGGGSPAMRQRRRASVHKTGAGGLSVAVLARLSDQGQPRDQLLHSTSLPFAITFQAAAGALSNSTASPPSSCTDATTGVDVCEAATSRPLSCPPSDHGSTPGRGSMMPAVPRPGRSSRPPSGRPSPLGPRSGSAATPEQRAAGLFGATPESNPARRHTSVDGVGSGCVGTVLPAWGGCTPFGPGHDVHHRYGGVRHAAGEDEGADGFRISTVLTSDHGLSAEDDEDDVLFTGGSDKLARRDQHLRASSVGTLHGSRPPRSSISASSMTAAAAAAAGDSQPSHAHPWAAMMSAATCAPSSHSQPSLHRVTWPGARSGASHTCANDMDGVGRCEFDCPGSAEADEVVEEGDVLHGRAFMHGQHDDEPGSDSRLVWQDEAGEEDDDGCAPMEGLAVRLIHTEEDYCTPTHSPRSGDKAAVRVVGEQLPVSCLQPRPSRAHRRTDSSLAEGLEAGCCVPAEQLSSLEDFNLHLSQAALQGNRGRADSLWAELCSKGLAPNMKTLNALLRCLANSFAHPDEAELLAREVCKVGGLSPNSVTYNLIAETRFRYEQLCGFDDGEWDEEAEGLEAECFGECEREGLGGLGCRMDECGDEGMGLDLRWG